MAQAALLKIDPNELDFDEFILQLEWLVAADGYPGYITMTGYDGWKDYWIEGLSPQEAWDSERSYW